MGYRSVLSVTTPATTFDLTTLLRVKAALDINDATMQQDQWLRTAITSCSLAVARECNRVFPVQSYRETFYGGTCYAGYYGVGYDKALQLAQWPIVEITSLAQDSAALTANTDFIVDAASGQLIRLTGGVPLWWSAANITVEYDAGYATIPGDLQDIVHGLIQGQWQVFGSERDPLLRGEDIPGVASYQYTTLANAAGASFAATAKDAINPYRMPAFA